MNNAVMNRSKSEYSFKKPWDYLRLRCCHVLIAFLNLSSILVFCPPILIVISFYFVQAAIASHLGYRNGALIFLPLSPLFLLSHFIYCRPTNFPKTDT